MRPGGRKIRLAVLASFALLAFCRPALAARAELVYDGNLVQKTDFLELKGTEYLPLKSVAALFNGKTQWYPVAGKVVLQLRNQKITFFIDGKTAAMGNQKIPLGAPVRYVRGTVFVPIDFFLSSNFTEIVECKLAWDSSSLILTADPNVTLFAPRVFSRSKATRIVLESAEEIAPEFIKKGPLLDIDIPKVRVAGEETVKVGDSAVESVKVLPGRKGATIRVSLAKGATSYIWRQEKDPPRLIVEVQNPKAKEPSAKDEPLESSVQVDTGTALALKALEVKALEKVRPKAKGKTAGPASRSKRLKIVVDAGHGGKDVGAIGKMGTKEKDINLLIALELARTLRVEGGYDVVLTRSNDTFVSLLDRSLLANSERADLFISIHCNASIRKKEGGFEIYFLGEEDASDPHAEATADLENSVIQLEGPPSEKKKKLQDLLFSMARTEFINESSLLCHLINGEVKRSLGIPSRGVKQADFHVLHGVQMPSVLVETAFITYLPEEQKLRKRRFRSSMVDAIVLGVEEYEKKVAQLGR